jgi:hypothetical protein
LGLSPLTRTGMAFARTSPVAVASVNEPALVCSVRAAGRLCSRCLSGSVLVGPDWGWRPAPRVIGGAQGVVGQAGDVCALIRVVASKVMPLLTSLFLSAIATYTRVKGGGARRYTGRVVAGGRGHQIRATPEAIMDETGFLANMAHWAWSLPHVVFVHGIECCWLWSCSNMR